MPMKGRFQAATRKGRWGLPDAAAGPQLRRRNAPVAQTKQWVLSAHLQNCASDAARSTMNILAGRIRIVNLLAPAGKEVAGRLDQ